MKKNEERTQITVLHFVSIFLIIVMILIFSLTMMDINYFIKKYSDDEVGNITEGIKLNVSSNIIETNGVLLVESDMSKENIQIIEESMSNVKIPIRQVGSLDKFDLRENEDIGIIILSGKYLSSSEHITEILNLMDYDIDVVLTSIPDYDSLKSVTLLKQLGISNVKKPIISEEIRFLEGFMLGGLLEVENFEFLYSPVELLSTTKVYVNINKDAPLIWRNSTGRSRVFVINGPFMDTEIGYGILLAILSEINEDFIYPVVNAFTYTYRGLPLLSNENSVTLRSVYNRNSLLLQHDFLIPDIIAINKSRLLVPTSIITASYRIENTGELNTALINHLINYEKDFIKIDGLFGYELTGDIDLDLKYINSLSEYVQIDSLYDHNSAFDDDYLSNIELSKTIHSIIRPWEIGKNNFRIDKNGLVNVPITYTEERVRSEDVLDLYAFTTAFGIVTHHLDFERVIYPDDAIDEWINLSKKYIRFVDDYNKKFEEFEKCNTYETSNKIVSYILSEPIFKYYDTKIEVKVNNWQGEMSFILRTNKRVQFMTSGTAKMINENVYLITIKQPESVIELKEENVD